MGIARVGLALLVVAAAAHANSVILTSTDAGLGEQGLWINEEGRNVKLDWAGGINATIDGMLNGVLWSGQAFVDNNLNTNYNTVIDYADTAQLKRVGWMMANVVQSVNTPAEGAGFQLAIWDILEDNGDGFAVGAGSIYQSTANRNHKADATVLAYALQYEAQSVGKSFTWTPIYNNTILGGTPVQDLIGPLTYDGGPCGAGAAGRGNGGRWTGVDFDRDEGPSYADKEKATNATVLCGCDD